MKLIPAFISMHGFTPVMGSEPPSLEHRGTMGPRSTDRRSAAQSACRRSRTDGRRQPAILGRHPADYTVARHAERAKLPHVCIEVRQDQIDTRRRRQTLGGLLHSVLQPILLDRGCTID